VSTLSPTFSPDGARIAFMGMSGSEMDVWMAPIEGGASRRITFGLGAYRVRWDNPFEHASGGCGQRRELALPMASLSRRQLDSETGARGLVRVRHTLLRFRYLGGWKGSLLHATGTVGEPVGSRGRSRMLLTRLVGQPDSPCMRSVLSKGGLG